MKSQTCLPHRDATLIAKLRQAVESWRKENGWSRETLAQHLVEAHEAIGGTTLTGLVFDPPTRDAFERQRVNADRIYRWLDDVAKDRNLLPANFLPAVLAALPEQRRLAVLDDMLLPLGCVVRPIEAGRAPAPYAALFKAALKEDGEAEVAAADLLDHQDLDGLRKAQTEIAQAIQVQRRLLFAVENAISHLLNPAPAQRAA